MIDDDPVLLEFDRFVENANLRRQELLEMALSKARTKKILTRLSGLLSLLSAGAITSVIVKYAGHQSLQIVAAVSACLSGVISAFSSGIKEDDTAKIFAGATKYLDLRDRAFLAELKPEITRIELYNQLGDFIGEYQKLDEIYSKYFYKRKLPWSAGTLAVQSEPPRKAHRRFNNKAEQ